MPPPTVTLNYICKRVIIELAVLHGFHKLMSFITVKSKQLQLLQQLFSLAQFAIVSHVVWFEESLH